MQQCTSEINDLRAGKGNGKKVEIKAKLRIKDNEWFNMTETPRDFMEKI